MKTKIILGLIAVAAFLPLPFSAGQAYAQQSASSTAMPRIDGFDVDPVKKPVPGSELKFSLYGTPGGDAVVQVSGATGGVALVETDTGIYEGSYTIRKRDRVTSASTATANLRVGNRIASTVLDESLVGNGNSGRRYNKHQRNAEGPKINRFDVDSPERLVAGEELILTLTGTPGGTASARIAGVKRKIKLNEIRSGVYEGLYTIHRRDQITSSTVVTGNLRIGEHETSAPLGHKLQASSDHQRRVRQAARVCIDCGVVEAINLVEVKGKGSYLGMIAGGVAGALLGGEVGHGDGTKVAQVVGAAGGAYAGNEIEKRMKTSSHYEVVVRLDAGGTKVFSFAAQPGFAVGAKVKLENDGIRAI